MRNNIFEIADRSYGLIIKLEPSIKLLTVKVSPVMLAIIHDQASQHEQKWSICVVIFGNSHELLHVDFRIDCVEDLFEFFLGEHHVNVWVLEAEGIDTRHI